VPVARIEAQGKCLSYRDRAMEFSAPARARQKATALRIES
jgi:hypothetical protein